MKIILPLILILGIVFIIAIIVWLINSSRDSKTIIINELKKSNQELKKTNKELQNQINEIQAIVIMNKEIYPALSWAILNEITQSPERKL